MPREKDPAYGGKAWCPYWEDCASGASCPDAFNEAVRMRARAAKEPVQCFCVHPVCYVVKTTEE